MYCIRHPRVAERDDAIGIAGGDPVKRQERDTCLARPNEATSGLVTEAAAMKHIIPSVYILASGPNGTIYIGVTSDLYKRMAQHTQKLA